MLSGGSYAKKVTAYAWASGLIEFGETYPDGALPIITGEEKRVREIIEVRARHSRTNQQLLVPGVPGLITNMMPVLH